MQLFTKAILLAFTLLALGIPTAFGQGSPAPDYFLPDLHTGELRSLSEFKGRKVILLNFASW